MLRTTGSRQPTGEFLKSGSGEDHSGINRARYLGLTKTHLQHLLTAAAINLARLAAWLAGEPRTQTRQSRFVRLMAQPA